MAAISLGPISWDGGRDDEGYREYSMTSRVRAEKGDGPAAVMQASGLPAIGSTWCPEPDITDVDIWAFCTPYMRVERLESEEDGEGLYYTVEQKFSTRPWIRCQDDPVANPLLEPAKFSGSYTNMLREATTDKDGNLLLMSSLERMRGPEVEVEAGWPTVVVSLNYATLDVADLGEMRGTLNSTTMWGLSARKIRLKDATWERNFYGTCQKYFTVTYTFEVSYTTWNRLIVDEGTRYLYKSGVDATVFSNYIKARDAFDEPTTVLLNGSGRPATNAASVFVHNKALENETNFLLYSIPATI